MLGQWPTLSYVYNNVLRILRWDSPRFVTILCAAFTTMRHAVRNLGSRFHRFPVSFLLLSSFPPPLFFPLILNEILLGHLPASPTLSTFSVFFLFFFFFRGYLETFDEIGSVCFVRFFVRRGGCTRQQTDRPTRLNNVIGPGGSIDRFTVARKRGR